MSFGRQKQLRDVEIDRRLRGRSQLEQELQEAEPDMANQLAALELPDMAAAEELLRAEEAHVARIDRLAAQLEGLVGASRPKPLPGAARRGRPRDRAEDRRPGRPRAHRQGAARPRAPRGRGQGLRAGASRPPRDDEANARARVEANTVDAEEVAGQTERLAAWRSSWPRSSAGSASTTTTLQAIERAEQATMRTATRYLEKHMVGDLARVTDGRYRRVRVDDATLDIEVFAPERGDWVDGRQLSQGTLDLVYLAARLGLVRLVTGDRRPAAPPRRSVRHPRRRPRPPGPRAAPDDQPPTSRSST